VDVLYGTEWGSVLARKPDAVVLANGSEVAVFSGARIG
jgi:hypothetical protein